MSVKSDNSTLSLDFAGHAFPVEGLGPGTRMAMWVRGCPLACPSCLTPDLWESSDKRIPVARVAATLLPDLAKSDGLTISGGEPMEQALALVQLVRALREELPALEVLVYSGYVLEELELRPDARALLEEIDLLIDGRFVQSASNELGWRGSDNQRLHLLSQRARERHAEAPDAPMPAVRPLQMQPLGAGRFRMVGIPRRGDYERYRAVMAERGLEISPEVSAPDATARREFRARQKMQEEQG